MKLIELLVKKYKEEGWEWPDGYSYIAQDSLESASHPGVVFAYEKPPLKRHSYWVADNPSGHGKKVMRSDIVAEDCQDESVTRDQYEAALAAAQQPVWNGEGLPPAGCECEFIKRPPNTFSTWAKGVVMYVSDCTVVIKTEAPDELVFHPADFKFRPLCTEAERKREKIISSISHSLRANGSINDEQLERLYSDIAAGNIPGVKLEAGDAN